MNGRNGSDGGIAPSTVAAPYLFRALRAALELGARKPVLLDRLGLDERTLANPVARLSSIHMPRLLDAAAEETGNAALGLDLGLGFRPRSFSDTGYGSRFCATVGEAMQRVVDRQALNQTVVRLEMDVEGDELRFFLRFLGDDPQTMRRFTELVMTANLRSAWLLAGGEIGIRQIRFQHDAPHYAAHYGLSFGAPIEFGAHETVVVMRSAILDRVVPTANPAITDALDQRALTTRSIMDNGGDYAGLCTLYATSELDKAPVTLERAATVFGLNERSLRRRLREGGTTFRAILEAVRRELCELYRVEGTRSVGEVALLLGYSDTSAFTRAHSGWHGLPPSRAAIRHARPREREMAAYA